MSHNGAMGGALHPQASHPWTGPILLVPMTATAMIGTTGLTYPGSDMKQPGPGIIITGSGVELPGHGMDNGMDRTGMAMTRQHPLAISHKINRSRHNWYRLATNETQEVGCLCTHVLLSVVTQEGQG